MNAVVSSAGMFRLVIGMVVLALGFAAVMVGLWPVDFPAEGRSQDSRRIAVREVTAAACPCAVARAPAVPRAMPFHATRESTGTTFPPVSTTGPWISPLYPQNGVTLWDRIRVSPKNDRPGFLMGTAIQIHAPAIAATPGTRRDRLPAAGDDAAAMRAGALHQLSQYS